MINKITCFFVDHDWALAEEIGSTIKYWGFVKINVTEKIYKCSRCGKKETRYWAANNIQQQEENKSSEMNIAQKLTQQWLENMIALEAPLEIRTTSDVMHQMGMKTEFGLAPIPEEEVAISKMETTTKEGAENE